MKKKMNVIIGGGCTGLYLAKRLIDRNEDFILFEKRPVLGGKIRTSSLKLDQGAWRVNHDHKLLRDVLHDAKLVPLPETQGVSYSKSKPSSISRFAASLIDPSGSVLKAAVADLRTGYHSTTSAGNERSHGGTFYRVEQGFATVIDKLQQQIHHKCVHLSSKLVKIEKKFVVIQTGSKTKRWSFGRLFLCVPPNCIPDSGPFRHQVKAIRCAVKPLALHRIYAEQKKAPSADSDIVDVNTRHHRQLATQGQRWITYSYCSGAIADAWQEIVIDWGLKPLAKWLGFQKLLSYYWPEGTHMWRPVWKLQPAKNSLNARLSSNIWVLGEAVSDTQGWTEGALRTVEAALSKKKRKRKKGRVTYDGRPVNITGWAKKHPGGNQLIEDIKPGSDITQKFNNAHSTDYAYAQLFALLE